MFIHISRLLFLKRQDIVCQKKKLLTFNTNTKSMKPPKLTAILLSLPVLFLFSCKSTADVQQENIYYANITMAGAQEVPAVNTTATGTVIADYNRLTKTLSYSIEFSGLTDSAVAAHIHGIGEQGISAPVLQTFNNFPRRKAGTYSGSLLIDGIKFTEENLLARRYYINIHSKTYGGGEIRGQLVLAKKQ
jgi:hypothetical protein